MSDIILNKKDTIILLNSFFTIWMNERKSNIISEMCESNSKKVREIRADPIQLTS